MKNIRIIESQIAELLVELDLATKKKDKNTIDEISMRISQILDKLDENPIQITTIQ